MLSFTGTPAGTYFGVADSVITGSAAGIGFVSIRVSGLSSAYQLGSVMQSAGTEVPVVVTPPPSGPFRAVDITGIPQPITSAGTYSIQATVINVPGTPLTVKFKILYSIGTSGIPDTVVREYGPNQYSLPVHSGSYNIRISATPRVNGEIGAEYTEDFPVCTGGGGGGDLAAPIPDDGGGNDAVGGC